MAACVHSRTLRSQSALTVPGTGDLAACGGDPHLETVGDAAGAHDEGIGNLQREQLPRGCFEDLQPAIEMLALQGQHKVWPHRPPVVATCPQHDRGPEIRDLSDVVIPVRDSRIEDRPDQVVLASTAVEGSHQIRDRRLVDRRMHGIYGDRLAFGHASYLGYSGGRRIPGIRPGSLCGLGHFAHAADPRVASGQHRNHGLDLGGGNRNQPVKGGVAVGRGLEDHLGHRGLDAEHRLIGGDLGHHGFESGSHGLNKLRVHGCPPRARIIRRSHDTRTHSRVSLLNFNGR